MRYFIVSFTFLLFIFSSSNAAVYQEEVRYYDIEVLLFENIKQNPNNAETWPTSMEFEVPESSLFIGSPYPGPLPTNYNPRFTFKPIKSSTHQLKDEAKALTEHADYRVLYHRSWRQPGMKRDEAISVKFSREIPRLAYLPKADEVLEASQFEYNQIINQRLPKTNNLKGLIKIGLSRYLHISTDIQYTRHIIIDKIISDDGLMMEQVDPSFSEIKPQVYQLKQNRKMRSKELHYLDNPRLGLLVYITPVKISKK